MGACKQRQPLSAQQRALCEKWHPLACRYALLALQARRDMGHHMDEAEGLAGEALVLAARAYDSRRGPFPPCLRWHVYSVVKVYRAHFGQVVARSERVKTLPSDWSLDAPVGDGDATFADLLEAPAVDVAGALDAHSLMARAPAQLRALVAARSPREDAKASAALSVSLWLRNKLEGVSFDRLGAAHGVSRQAAEQRVGRVQRAFESWARGIREEAA